MYKFNNSNYFQCKVGYLTNNISKVYSYDNLNFNFADIKYSGNFIIQNLTKLSNVLIYTNFVSSKKEFVRKLNENAIKFSQHWNNVEVIKTDIIFDLNKENIIEVRMKRKALFLIIPCSKREIIILIKKYPYWLNYIIYYIKKIIK